MKITVISILLMLILSGCMTYECKSTDGKRTLAHIKMTDSNMFLTSESATQICEIVRKDMGK